MIKFTLKSLIILLSLFFLKVNSQCETARMISHQLFHCGNAEMFDSSYSNFPAQFMTGTGPSIINIDLILNINDMGFCGISAADILPFFTLAITPGSEGVPKKIIDFYWDGVADYVVTSETSLTTDTILTISGRPLPDIQTSIEFFGGIDLSTSEMAVTAAIEPSLDSLPGFVPLGIGGDWYLDSTVQIYICSDGTTVIVSCFVESLVFWFEYPIQVSPEANFYMYGVSPILFAKYIFQERGGTTIEDEVGFLGTANFGTGTNEAPEWLVKESGVKFTSQDQYIRFPTVDFTDSESYSALTRLSITFRFWISIESGTQGYLFRYSSDDLNDDRIALKIRSDGVLECILDGNILHAPSSLVITDGIWHMLAISFLVTAEGFQLTYVVLDDLRDNLDQNSISLPAFAPTDVIQIGGPNGFLGRIAQFEIYNPGSTKVETPCVTPTCSHFQLGVTEFEGNILCLFHSTCHATCETSKCFGDSQNECYTCPSTEHLFPDNSCQSTCPSPALPYPDPDTGILYCPGPCTVDVTHYYHADRDRCEPECLPHYVEDTSTFYRSCISLPCHATCQTCFDGTENGCDSCPPTQFLYQNNSCKPECIPPLRPETVSSVVYCVEFCLDETKYYHPETNQCETTCLKDYIEDTSTPYKSCLYAPNLGSTPFSESSEDVIEVSTLVVKMVTQVLNAVSFQNPTGISTYFGSKIFSDIKYLKITYSAELYKILESNQNFFISIEISPKLPNSITERIDERPIPWIFRKYEVSSSFLLNFWENIFVLLIVTGVLLITITGETVFKFTDDKLFLHKIFKMVRISAQNNLWIQLYSMYGELLMYSVLEYKSSMDLSLGLTWLSFIISLFLLFVMLIGFKFHVKLVRKFQFLKKESEEKQNKEKLTHFIENQKGSEVLFQDFKDDSFKTQGFLIFFTIRDLLFSISLILLVDHTIIQCILILLFNASIFVYLFIQNPFDKRIDFFQQAFYELLIMFANLLVMILAIQEEVHSDAERMRKYIGRTIIIANIVFHAGALIFNLGKLILEIKEFIKNYINSKKAKNTIKVSNIKKNSVVPETLARQRAKQKRNSLEDVLENADDSMKTSLQRVKIIKKRPHLTNVNSPSTFSGVNETRILDNKERSSPKYNEFSSPTKNYDSSFSDQLSPSINIRNIALSRELVRRKISLINSKQFD